MNAQVVGMDTWHHENNPEGATVEMHGNIRWDPRSVVYGLAVIVQ
jgi:hypothetical protein